jgi:osmoprotectant transport system ATP-binding protein
MVEPDSGTVAMDGVHIATLDAVALRRRIGYVPQTGGLLPHWNVLRNVALVPRLIAHADAELAGRAALDRCGLPAEQFGHRFPHELSGGQRQRVALARAIAASQHVLLLDESFGALDAISRHELHEAFLALRASVGFTGILVTHDLAEAARLAESIAVMRAGRIEQCGSLRELQTSPATPYVSQLLDRAQASARSLTAT